MQAVSVDVCQRASIDSNSRTTRVGAMIKVIGGAMKDTFAN